MRIDKVARDIGDEPERRGADHDRHDGEAVEPVGQIDRIAERDDDEWAEQQEGPAEIEHEAAHERHGKLGRAIGADTHQRITGERSDDIFAKQARTAREPTFRLLRDFQVIVVKADHGEAGSDEQHDPNIRAFEIGPKQSRDKQPEQDHEPAHGRRALLGEKMRSWPIGTDRLALSLFPTKGGDYLRTEEEDEKKPRPRSAERAEGEVSEKVESAWKLGEPGEHVLASRAMSEAIAERRDERAHPA